MLNNIEAGQTSVEKLIEYQKQGYLFHGSPANSLTLLEPKPATDAQNTSGFNIDTAVFASNDPAPAVLFGCIKNTTSEHNLNGNWSVGGTKKEGNIIIIAKIPRSWQRCLTGSIGYVYVLNNQEPTKESDDSWQVKIKGISGPVDCIQVCFEDFEKLSGIIEWVDSHV